MSRTLLDYLVRLDSLLDLHNNSFSLLESVLGQLVTTPVVGLKV